jgi:hypothetical protein
MLVRLNVIDALLMLEKNSNLGAKVFASRGLESIEVNQRPDQFTDQTASDVGRVEARRGVEARQPFVVQLS